MEEEITIYKESNRGGIQTLDLLGNENRKGYKKTKLGWIPEEWEIAKLREYSKIDNKNLSGKTDENYRFNYISLSDVTDGKIKYETLIETDFKNAPSRARRIVKKGDVLMSTVRPNLKAFAIINTDVDNLIASTGFAVITTNKRLDSDYLYNFLFSRKMESQLYNLVVGSNYPAINSSEVKNLTLAIPNLPEQTAI